MAEVPPVVALFGATALGKSDVALELAGLLGADILVADSMQAYAGLPILTNQPGAEARSRARYHLVAWATPQEEVSVARFSRRAHTVVDELLAAGTPVVVEGGSGLYLRAVLGDLGFGSPPDEARRRLLEDRWRRAPEELVAELRAHHDEWETKYGVSLAVTGYTAVGIDVSNLLFEALLPFGILVIGLALNWLRSHLRLSAGQAFFNMAMLVIALGALGAINTWDLPTYALLVLGALMLRGWRRIVGAGLAPALGDRATARNRPYCQAVAVW